MSLDKLSNELLVQIASWLDSTSKTFWTRKQSLVDLALCSRRLNTIATPIIYNSFDDRNEEVLPRFLRTLLANPDLGIRVKSFSVIMVQMERSQAMAGYKTEDFQRVTSAVERVNAHRSWDSTMATSSTMAWTTRIRLGNRHALAALTLFNLPNLTEIKLGSYHPESPYNEDLGRGCLHSIPAALNFMGSTGAAYLPFLESIWVSARDPEYGLNYPSIIPFLRLSSVKTVSFGWVLGADFNDSFETFDTEELAFYESCCSGESMIRFLRYFPQLKSFLYEHNEAGDQQVEFDAIRFGQAIAHLKPSLEYLHIDNIDDHANDPTDHRQFGLLGSLHDFQSLEILEIDANILLGSHHGHEGLAEQSSRRLHELLPSSLQYLELNKCAISIVQQLWDLVKWKQRTRSSLKSITVRWRDYPDLAAMGVEARYSHEHESLIKAFSDAGVHMNLQLMVHGVTN